MDDYHRWVDVLTLGIPLLGACTYLAWHWITTKTEARKPWTK